MSEPKCPVPTGLALTALDPVFRETPHQQLDCLRAQEPVHRDRMFDRVVLTRAQDISSVLNDRSMVSDPRKGRPGSYARVVTRADDESYRPSLLTLDDPDHKRIRDLVSIAFNQRAVDAMRPRIQEVADHLLDPLAKSGSFDVVEAYAKPLPTIVIAEMLGVEPQHQADFKLWSDAQLNMFNPLRTPEQHATVQWGKKAQTEYLIRTIRERRERRGTDLISNLINAEESGSRLSEAEIVSVCHLLLIAGNLTTTDLIGNGVLALLEHPGELAKLRAQPALARNMVEEVLRFDPPVASATRIATVPTEIDGVLVEPGQTIISLIMGANSDPALHANAREFDIERPGNRHYSFGGGVHFCLGAPLARAEGQIAIPLVFSRFPRIRLAEAKPRQHKANPAFNGLESLWVQID